MKTAWMRFLFFSFSFFTAYSAFACTDFRITAKDNTVLISRSLEFALDLNSNLRTSPRGRMFNTTTANGQQGLSWKAKNGYVFLDALDMDMTVDGMNEKGLSFEALYLPGFAKYQTAPTDKTSQVLPYYNMGDWILSSFDTVDQVKDALKNVYVVEQKLPGAQGDQANLVFPLHFAVYDASGKGIIIEYVDGKLTTYDNQIGVMTNSPTYDWHLMNMNNFVRLVPTNPTPVEQNGVSFAALGQGFGMIGVPGDISPPSRFVKIGTMLRVIIQPDNATGALNMAQHVMNNVDIPLGLAREKQEDKYTNELTQWAVFKDLTNKVFYYRTYNDTTLRGVSLSKLNFAENAQRLKMPISGKQFIQDMTDQFLKTNATPPVIAA